MDLYKTHSQNFVLLCLSLFLIALECVKLYVSAEHQSEFQREITIKAAAGTIIGHVKDVQVFGKPYKVARFLGIPYAEPPEGELRFQKPVARQPFSTPLVAKQHGLACLQQESDFLGGKQIETGENCLNLNVYRPDGCSGETLATMVWFHGGGFATGSSDPYLADYLAAYGRVMVVTVNYRLSVWGFLSLGDVTPGNLGLWDQHLALKWVNKNIENFGGDKDQVTIFGQSVGAASVVYQSLYAGNQGLFQQAIAQSSSVTSPWAFADKSRDDETQLAKLLGCDTGNSTVTKTFQCINSTSNEDLLKAIEQLPGPETMLRMSVIATKDGDFVKDTPALMLSSNNQTFTAGQEFFNSLNFLSGVTSTESTGHALLLSGTKDSEHFNIDQKHFDNHLIPLVLERLYNTEVPSAILDLVRAEYRDWNEQDNQSAVRDNYIQLISDVCHNVPLIQTLKFHARPSKSRTYAYMFSEKPTSQLCPTPHWSTGAHHSDELQFVFGPEPEGMMSWVPGERHQPRDWEIGLSKTVITYWTNFAKSG